MDFAYQLDSWEEKIKAKLQVVQWLANLNPEDFAILVCRLILTSCQSFNYDQERYDKTLNLTLNRLADIVDMTWHLKQEVFDYIESEIKENSVTIGHQKDNEIEFFFVDNGEIHKGETLFAAVRNAKKNMVKR